MLLTLAYPENTKLRVTIVAILFTVYVAAFVIYFERAGLAVAAFSTIPVMTAGWYFGSSGGMLTAVFLVLTNFFLLIRGGVPYSDILGSPDYVVAFPALMFIGFVVGRLGSLVRERQEIIRKLEQYEQERNAHTDFLERLNSITSRALEADSLQATLNILVEGVGKLFRADDCFFSLWDEARGVPAPTAAYGSMMDIFNYVQFEPQDRLPSTYALQEGRPLAIGDLQDSPYIESKIAAIYPSRSMLVIPLMTEGRKMGALLLGFNQHKPFSGGEMDRAQTTAEQLTQVLSKSLLLEEERKQVRQLSALHDISLIAIEVDNEDELINHVTDVIGQNLFPDNFGILLFDEQTGMLNAHPSYRFSSAGGHRMMNIPVELGITGLTARTGQAQRWGNVHQAKEYLAVDDQTVSELTVPIKFKERILGVINAESTRKDAFTEEDERLLVTLAGQLATALEQIRKAEAERKWLDQLAHSNDLIYALAQITTRIEKAFSRDDIVRNLGKELKKIGLTSITTVYDRERDLLTISQTSLELELIDIVEDALGRPMIKYSFAPGKLGSENLVFPTVLPSPLGEIEKLFTHLSPEGIATMLENIGVGATRDVLRLPMMFEENLLGILWVWGEHLTRADLPIMSIFAKQIGVSLERARLFQEVQNLALTDHLTGLQNRRSLFELGRVEFTRAERMNRPLSCMMLDLDYFKQINDHFGHAVGDQVLKEFSRRCKSSVREIDLVGRYGGEELVILLPETDRRTAMLVAERLRDSISATPIRAGDREISVTVSIGVATKDEHTPHLDALIARSDQAMYIAKHRGRNLVALSK